MKGRPEGDWQQNLSIFDPVATLGADRGRRLPRRRRRPHRLHRPTREAFLEARSSRTWRADVEEPATIGCSISTSPVCGPRLDANSAPDAVARVLAASCSATRSTGRASRSPNRCAAARAAGPSSARQRSTSTTRPRRRSRSTVVHVASKRTRRRRRIKVHAARRQRRRARSTNGTGRLEAPSHAPARPVEAASSRSSARRSWRRATARTLAVRAHALLVRAAVRLAGRGLGHADPSCDRPARPEVPDGAGAR